MSVRSPPAILAVCLLLAACGEVGNGDSTDESNGSTAVPAGLTADVEERVMFFDDRQSLDALFAFADEVYGSGEYDSAAVLFRRIHDRARREGALPAQARALTWVGLARWRLGDYRTARQVGEEALAFKLRHRLVDQYSRSYNALGLVAWHETRLSDAERRYQQAIESAEEVGDRGAAAVARGNMALVHTELGRFELARSGFLAQRAVMAELGVPRAEGNAVTNLGMLEIRLGNPQGAIPLLRQALDLYESIDYGTGVQSALGQLGTAYTALGDSRQAFTMLDSALAIATAQGLEQERASIMEAVAELYRGAGDFRRALELYDSARNINAELGLDIETGVDFRGEADIHVRLGDVARARGAAEEALAIHRRAGAPLEVLNDLLMLAEIQDRLDEGDEVEGRLREARALADALGARIARVEVGLTEARIAGRHGRSNEVLSATRRIDPDLTRGGYTAEWEARLLESRALERLGRNREAAAAGRRALATVERVRSNFGSGVLRTAFVADKSEVFGHLISVLLRLGEVEEAFAVADAARGRVLLERLSAAGATAAGEIRTEAFSQGEILLTEIDRLVESIDAAEATPPGEMTVDQSREVARLYDRLAQARDAYEGMLVRVAETDRANAAFVGGAQTDVAAVRAALQSNQLLVEYFVPPDGQVVIFVASRDGVRVLQSQVNARNLASRVRLARELMARGDESEGSLHGVLTSLHEALIGPLTRAGILSGIEDLIIVPHQVLAYLPFAALRDGTTDRYLVQDFTTRRLPSAAALPVLAQRSLGASVDRVSFAFAPFPDDLPATRLEVRAVSAGGGNTRRYLGPDATERALRRALRETGTVHVATHGVMNAQNPMFSRLELVRNNGGEPADDGRLEVHELLGLTIRSGLVFLSGCETGVGAAHSTAFVQGEDYTTLAQAFLHAGAGTVIATLWPVEDAGAAAFAEVFYRELETHPPVKALAEARRAMMVHEKYGSPYYWAAYQLSGYRPPDPAAHAGADIRAIEYVPSHLNPAGLAMGPRTAR